MSLARSQRSHPALHKRRSCRTRNRCHDFPILLSNEARSFHYLDPREAKSRMPSVPDHFETGLVRVLKHWYWANNYPSIRTSNISALPIPCSIGSHGKECLSEQRPQVSQVQINCQHEPQDRTGTQNPGGQRRECCPEVAQCTRVLRRSRGLRFIRRTPVSLNLEICSQHLLLGPVGIQ